MYLEISGRRTGKTTRLVEAARKARDDGFRVSIISPASSIYRKEYSDLDWYFTPFSPIFRVVDKIFVDEYDCLPMDRFWYKDNQNCLYVCGTPSVKGLSKELVLLQPEYESFKTEAIIAEQWIGNMDKDVYEREFLAKFAG